MAGVVMEWESRLGRRLRVRDLYILSAVVKAGSMAKAARQLAISQPAVSEAIANLEHILGVTLLDRNPRGVEPTLYGAAILKRSTAVFDELSQSVKDVAFLAAPTAGELRIGCPESIACSLLPPVVERFGERYSAVVLDVDGGSTAEALVKLADRSLDLVLARTPGGFSDHYFGDAFIAETLFHDTMVIVAGMHTPWARRRKIDIGELASEYWILAQSDTWNYAVVEEAFRERGLAMPPISMKTLSVHLRANMVTAGNFITVLPKSVMALYGARFALKTLPVILAKRPWPVTLVTVKSRTLSPLVERFVECARETAKQFQD
jgi:DNA-binding transcriptional LysR family regulator